MKAINLVFLTFLLSFVFFLKACDTKSEFLEDEINARQFVSPQELKLRKYYTRMEKRKLSMELLRQDGGGLDTPFDVNDLIEAFEQLAFYNEYNISNNQLSPNPDPVSLGKWSSKINVAVRFGSSININQKNKDLLEIRNLISLLSKITNHEMVLSDKNVNMYVVVGNQKEISELTDEIGLYLTEFDPRRIPVISKLPKDIHCMAMTSMNSRESAEIKSALVIIRSELPEIMRRACFHEEIAQSLGLTNDSHLARPSIFNDDDEFATITRFDEILLKILYDSRLKSGTSRKEASQTIKKITNEITTFN